MKSQISIVILFVMMGGSIFYAQENDTPQTKENSAQGGKDLFRNKVMVVAHRGDWRNAPENSLPAVQNCIDMGVDMVEIDLQRTKDGILIIMHDKTLERTSTGTGPIEDQDFNSIDGLRLKNGYGVATIQKVPTLLQVLELCKNKILVFLDKNYKYIPEVAKMVEELQMEGQVFYGGKNSFNEVKADYGKIIEEINYIPRVSLSSSTDAYMMSFLKLKKKPIFVFSFEEEEINEIRDLIVKTKAAKGRIMLTTLWKTTSGGYTDDLAVSNPDGNWGKTVDLGADSICTDRPATLLNYLRKKGLHD